MSRDVNYYRVWPGEDASFARQCYAENFVGVDFLREINLSEHLRSPLEDFQINLGARYREGNRLWHEENNFEYSARLQALAPDKLALIHQFYSETESSGIIVMPDQRGNCIVGEVSKGYHYAKGGILPHRLGVKWLTSVISQGDLDEESRAAIYSEEALTSIDERHQGIDSLIASHPRKNPDTEPVFGVKGFEGDQGLAEELLTHLDRLELPTERAVSAANGWTIQQPYSTAAGNIDVCAFNEASREVLVFELNRDVAEPADLGRALGHMATLGAGARFREYAIKGCIVGLSLDKALGCAIGLCAGKLIDIDFYYYERDNFRLTKHQAGRQEC